MDICYNHFFGSACNSHQCVDAHSFGDVRNLPLWAFFSGNFHAEQVRKIFSKCTHPKAKFYLFPRSGVVIRFGTVLHCTTAVTEFAGGPLAPQRLSLMDHGKIDNMLSDFLRVAPPVIGIPMLFRAPLRTRLLGC